MPEGAAANLLKPENKAALTKILACHLVKVDALSGAIKTMIDDDMGKHPVPTISGYTLMVIYMGDKIMLEDENGRIANVTIADAQ